MLKIDKLMSGYGDINIIHDISFEAKRGEIVSIIGRNGVGKSTLMKTLIGLIKAKQGKILFEDKDITQTKAFERAQMGLGYVPQGHGVFPLLTVEENLRMGFLIHKEIKEKDLEIAYEYFPRLRERRAQKAGTLSGGEQAMLSIARALVGKPELILLDEPSEGIQPNLAIQIGEIVKRCSEEMGITIILCEQHMGLIQQVSQRCYAIDKGTVIAVLEQEEIREYESIKKYLAV